MNVPITAGEASVAVLTLLILKEVLVAVLPNKKHDFMTRELCQERHAHLEQMVSNVHEATSENRKAIERNLAIVQQELKELPFKINGSRKGNT